LADWQEAARAAEDAGFVAAWSNELHRTAFMPLAGAAVSTSTIALGTAVALAFVRSPLVTALEALDLDELCGGRLVLGLGSGVKRLVESWHGAAFEHPAARLRQTVARSSPRRTWAFPSRSGESWSRSPSAGGSARSPRSVIASRSTWPRSDLS